MNTLKLCIDPGVYAIAWAIGYNGALIACGYYPTSKVLSIAKAKSENHVKTLLRNFDDTVDKQLFIEKPIHQRNRAINQQDIKNLLVIAKACAVLPDTHMVTPSAWKGTIPKDKHQPRILAMLHHNEQVILKYCRNNNATDHNIIDAIGLFLWTEKRLKR